MIKGSVYSISISDKKVLYVGSTVQRVKQRFNEHKYNLTRAERGGISLYFKPNQRDDLKLEVLYEGDFVDSRHMRAIEQLYINKLKAANRLPAFNVFPKKKRI